MVMFVCRICPKRPIGIWNRRDCHRRASRVGVVLMNNVINPNSTMVLGYQIRVVERLQGSIWHRYFYCQPMPPDATRECLLIIS